MYTTNLDQLPAILEKIGSLQALYLPQKKNGKVDFHPWEEGSSYESEALNAVKSPKDFFFPQSETIVSFKTQGKTISVETPRDDSGTFVLFGVRACDAAGLEVLDRVFLAEPVDSFYQAKRELGTVVTVACNQPEETCFCGAFGIDAAAPGGDVAVWLDDSRLYWEALTSKGEALTGQLSDLLKPAEDTATLEQRKAAIRDLLSRLPLARVQPESIGGALTDIFASAQWADLSATCMGCGTCTFVCPTCQCYDIQDFDTGKEIQRLRCWDSCMYSDFTLMAHGNPRTSQLERFRQRFMHKLVYFPENNGGLYSCVGCGRCVAKCPVSMNIVKVIKTLGVNAHV